MCHSLLFEYIFLLFFEMFCSVDGVGVKKALRAMVRPVRDVATLIEEQDSKGLSTSSGAARFSNLRLNSVACNVTGVSGCRSTISKLVLLIASSTIR